MEIPVKNQTEPVNGLCDICGFVCSKIQSMKSHMQVHRSFTPNLKNAKFKCQICNAKYETEARLKMHSISHKKRPFSCPRCKVKVSTQSALKRHINLLHSKEKSEVSINNFNCVTCDKVFTDSERLELHIRRVHVPKHKSFKCEICSKCYNERYHLERHHRFSHLEKFCKFCRIHFEDMSDADFKKHVEDEKQKAMKPKEICDKCGGSFVNLKQHRKSHFPKDKPGEKIFSCIDCSLSFTNKYCLQAHVKRKHAEKTIKCPNCDKNFADTRNLKNHLIVQHKTVKCEYCGKTIRYRALKEHINNVHKQIKRYQCGICEAQFSDYAAIKEHCYVHSTAKRLNCHLCERGFIDLRSIKNHYLSIHGIEKTEALKLCIRKAPDVPEDTYIKLF